MSQASVTAQQFVKDNIGAVRDIHTLSSLYASETRKSQLGKSVEGSFTGAINAIRLYNMGVKSAGLTTKDFHEAIAEANPELDAYITKMEADGKKPTEWGYIIQTNRARLATAGLTIAAAAIPGVVNGIAKSGTLAAESVGALATAIGAASIALGVFNVVKGAGNPFALFSLGISSLVAGIGALNAAAAKQREEWQQNIDAMDEAADSSTRLAAAYANAIKYYNALQNGEDVGNDFKNAVADLNKELGDNKVRFNEAKESAAEYAKTLAEGAKTSLVEMAMKASSARKSVSEKIGALGKPYLSQVMADLGLILKSWKTGPNPTRDWFARGSVGRDIDDASAAVLQSKLRGYYSDGKIGVRWGATEESTMGNLADYYRALIDARDELYTKGLNESSAFKAITAEADKYEEVVQEAISATYQEAKLNYEIANGIPTTKEEYDRLTASLRNVAAATGSQYLQEQMLAKAYDEFSGIISELGPKVTTSGEEGRVALKAVAEILEEVQDGYDGLAGALKEMSEQGYLSADSLETLYKLQKDNKLAGIDLNDVITRGANGYELASDALRQYCDALIKAYSNYKVFASVQDKDNAIENLLNLKAVLITLRNTQLASSAKNEGKAQKKIFEEQKDALDDELDAYKKLIDLRKKLLKSYEDERSYQKNLEKKQKNLAKLSTQLTLSKLDTSAAGQARTRELAEQVDEAQDDFDDFTLDHAIEKLTGNLDAQYAEYEQFIDGKISEIEAAIKNLDVTPEVNIDTSWIDDAITNTETLIGDLKTGQDTTRGTIENEGNATRSEVANVKHNTTAIACAYGESGIIPEGFSGVEIKLGAGGAISSRLDEAIRAIRGISIPGSSVQNTQTTPTAPEPSTSWTKGISSGSTAGGWLTKDQFYLSPSMRAAFGTYTEYLAKVSPSASTNVVLTRDEFLASPTDRTLFGTYEAYLKHIADERLKKSRGIGGGRTRDFALATYHSGGVVGGAELGRNEEFAKLMKGEFVSTPAMIQKFMNQTLPAVASGGGGTNEFNAPLIEINCESVTSEAMPRLEAVVQNAVKQIKKELDGGMSRNGYKGTVKKLSI